MKLHSITAIALVVLVATAGVAVAAPGNAPDNPGQADDEHGMSDDAPDGEPVKDQSANEDHDVNRSENASAAEDRGVEMSENASASQDNDVNRSENESAANGDVSAANAQGPDEDLPSPIPDHVAQIHDLIRQFLGGELEGSLGEAISGVTASDDAADASA